MKTVKIYTDGSNLYAEELLYKTMMTAEDIAVMSVQEPKEEKEEYSAEELAAIECLSIIKQILTKYE